MNKRTRELGLFTVTEVDAEQWKTRHGDADPFDVLLSEAKEFASKIVRDAGLEDVKRSDRDALLGEHGAQVYQAFEVLDALRAIETDPRFRDADYRRDVLRGVVFAAADAKLLANLWWEKAVSSKRKIEKNIRPKAPTVTDEQIRKVIADNRYPTRATQAKQLGFEGRNAVRSLNKRIAKLPKA